MNEQQIIAELTSHSHLVKAATKMIDSKPASFWNAMANYTADRDTKVRSGSQAKAAFDYSATIEPATCLMHVILFQRHLDGTQG